MQIEKKCCDHKIIKKPVSFEQNEDTFPENVLNTIHDIAKKESFIKYYINKKSTSSGGGNYLGILYEVNVKGEAVHGDKEINLFVKCTIDGDHHIIISVSEAYTKECFFYNEISKVFTKLQDEAKVPVGERLKTAKKYDASLDAIILENLTTRGFITYHRMEVIPIAFAKLAIEQLAKIHGLFYALERKHPEYFAQNLKEYGQVFICNKEWEDFMISNSKVASAALEGEMKEKIIKFIPKVIELYKKYFVERNGPFLTICHGDYKLNNILVKETNGEASEVIPVDYQIMYYGNPMNDFMYFIYTSTDRQFRNKYLEMLKDLYHNSLTRFLKYFSLDINEIFPRTEFDKQFQERIDFFLLLALYGTPFFFADENYVPDIVSNDITNINFVLDPRGHQRLKEVVEELIEMGYL